MRLVVGDAGGASTSNSSRNVLAESIVSCSPRGSHFVLPDWRSICGDEVRSLAVLISTSNDVSRGARQFIASTYPVLKQHNPDLPIMIREAKCTPARVFARFGASDCSTLSLAQTESGGLLERGVERHVEVDNLPEKDVASRVAQLLNQS